MKVLAPVSRADEVEMLVENGAEELYCGVVPKEWLDAYTGAIWLNRRSPAGANLESWDSLRALVDAAHARRVPVFLTLNAPVYNDRQLATVRDLAKRAAEESGVDAFIVSDVGLLLTMVEFRLPARLHISSVASALNSEALGFYRDLGASRVILPRALSLREIARLTGAVSGVEVEAFVLNDGCAFEEGLCHTTHHHRLGAFCTGLTEWPYDALEDDGRPASDDVRDAVEQHMRRYREWVWRLNGCGGALAPGGAPGGPCGLCAIPDLYRLGVASVKIVGREASPLRKLISLRLVRAVVELVRSEAPADRVRASARRFRNAPEACESGLSCYYRDFGRT